MRDTLRLLRMLWSTGKGTAAAITAIRLIEKLLPAATAVVVGLLVSRVTALNGLGGLGAVLLPLAAFGVVLLVSHAAEAWAEPLAYLAQQRIDGAHRAAVTSLVAGSPTIDLLEQPEAQHLIRQAKADPDEYTQRTPGQAALAELDQAASAVGIAALSLTVAQFAWWLVPLLLIPSLACGRLRYQQRLEFIRLWRDQVDVLLRADRWQEALASAGVGKDLRIFGFGGWAVRRLLGLHVARGEPMFALWQRHIRSQLWIVLLVTTPLLIAITAVVRDTVSGRGSIATETAVVTAAVALFTVIGSGDSALTRLAGLEAVKALDRLAEHLGNDARRPLSTP